MEHDKQLREQLVKLLRGGQASKTRDEILQGISLEEAGRKAANLPYTIWQLLEHLRIAQWDILEFSRNSQHQSPEWPEGYWPQEKAPANEAALNKTLHAITTDLEGMVNLIKDPANDLFEPFAHGNGQNLLREAMLVAEHNAYHLGEIVVLKRLIGDWE
ncbi:DinB family protein [Pontibacter pamirensis]|uniref:DinB family protein n=1 Tax=Pontibacter pamirensis TaxID=2562824 RepID=UPI0013899B74|nr:DinB family protein [Pontibacter pamirensis]